MQCKETMTKLKQILSDKIFNWSLRKEAKTEDLADTIMSLFSEYGEINPEWEKEFDKQDFCWTDDSDGKRKLHTNRDVTDEVKQFIRNQLRHEQRGKI